MKEKNVFVLSDFGRGKGLFSEKNSSDRFHILVIELGMILNGRNVRAQLDQTVLQFIDRDEEFQFLKQVGIARYHFS